MGRCTTSVRTGGILGGCPKKGLQAEIQNDIVTEIEALLGRGAMDDPDFEALETALRRQALRLAARSLEQRMNAEYIRSCRASTVPPWLRKPGSVSRAAFQNV